jgi:hypothetical protein
MESRETPVGHARNALALLTFARERVREVTIPPDAELLDLLDAARGRIWRVVNELEAVERPALPGWWWKLWRLTRRVGWLEAGSRGMTTWE